MSKATNLLYVWPTSHSLHNFLVDGHASNSPLTCRTNYNTFPEPKSMVNTTLRMVSHADHELLPETNDNYSFSWIFLSNHRMICSKMWPRDSRFTQNEINCVGLLVDLMYFKQPCECAHICDCIFTYGCMRSCTHLLCELTSTHACTAPYIGVCISSVLLLKTFPKSRTGAYRIIASR